MKLISDACENWIFLVLAINDSKSITINEQAAIIAIIELYKVTIFHSHKFTVYFLC